MRGDYIQIKEISNGYVAEYEEKRQTGRGEDIEVYFKTVDELNSFISDFYTKKEVEKEDV